MSFLSKEGDWIFLASVPRKRKSPLSLGHRGKSKEEDVWTRIS
jgi:hypothetical protein